MGIKEEVLRALEYGKTPYYNAIRSIPSYQSELERVRTDYNERTWIDFKGFFPKFTTEEFERLRLKYQSKYGTKINVPGFSDVVHIIPKARISPEERAAHLWATKRGLPSPLTPAQIETLQYKKFRFLKALASPTPTWVKNAGAVMTVLDNVEDSLVTISVLGRIAVNLVPRLLGRLVPFLGWVLLGSDILNAVNLISWVPMAAMSGKRKIEAIAEKNPFHAKAAARRALRLNKTLPGLGETLEILQTTDQLFGIGLCLGGLMGMVTDIATKVMTYSAQEVYSKMPQNPNSNELAKWAYDSFASDVEKFKKLLTQQYKNFADEAYRLKQWDIGVREKMIQFGKETSGILWNKIKTIPEKASKWFSNTLIGSMIMSTEKDVFLKEDHTKSFMMLNLAIQGIMDWWIENDPLEAFKDLPSFGFRVPPPTDPSTIDILNDYDPNWTNTLAWPHLDKEYATIGEILTTYSPMIKDSFQTYALKYSHEWEAMIAGQQIVEFTKNVIRSFSDDHEVKVGMSAWWAIAEDMLREVYLIPPDVPKSTIEALADYIATHERKTGIAPKIQDVARYGESIGIKWMRTFPKVTFDEASEIFPFLKSIQDQLDDLFVPG